MLDISLYYASTLNAENSKKSMYFLEIKQEQNSRKSEEFGNGCKKYTELSRVKISISILNISILKKTFSVSRNLEITFKSLVYCCTRNISTLRYQVIHNINEIIDIAFSIKSFYQSKLDAKIATIFLIFDNSITNFS